MNVRELFGDISPTYDLLNKVLSLGADRRWRKKGIFRMPHEGGLKILDLASGTFDLAIEYLHHGKGEVYCLDFSLPMILKGKAKIPPALNRRTHIVCGDGHALPFPEKFFDASMCSWGIRNFSDPTRGLKELKRVLKPGGTLLIIEFFRPVKFFPKFFSKTYGRYCLPAVGKWISGHKEAYRYLNNSIQSFESRPEYEQKLEENGFQVIHSEELTGGISSLILSKSHDNPA